MMDHEYRCPYCRERIDPEKDEVWSEHGWVMPCPWCDKELAIAVHVKGYVYNIFKNEKLVNKHG